ncbi:MAG: phage major capsid protein [Zymomonas sp.]|nr:MAG: phage major capsid protein [Zymomonas sp.]
MNYKTRTALSAVATLLAHPFRAFAAKPVLSLSPPTLNTLATAGGLSVPRAIAGARVKMDAADPKVLIAQIQAAVKEMRETNDTRLDKIESKVDPLDVEKFDKISATVTDMESALNAINAKLAATALDGAGKAQPTDPEYTKQFASYVRDGAHDADLKAAHRPGQPRAAMTEGSNADGGYTTPVEWDRTISGRLKLISAFRQNAQVQATSKAGFTKLFTDRAVGSGWVGETASRPATSTPQFTALSFGVGELYANPAASQTLLDDAEIDIEAWLAGEVETEFERQESIAFLSGDGVNKPYGIMTYITGGTNAARHPWGDIKVTASGDAALIKPDPLIDMIYSLPAAYSPNAKFYSNRNALAALRKLKDGQGNYLWQPTYVAGQPSTLAGYALVDMPDMPGVGAGTVPLLFGDMQRTYLIIDRMGVRVLRDPYTNKPYVSFYTTKRVGGGVQNPDAMKAYKISA